MARKITTLSRILQYDNADMVAKLDGQKIVWVTALVEQLGDTDAYNGIVSTIKEGAGWRDGIFLSRFDTSLKTSDTDVWGMYARDVADVADDMGAYSVLGSAVTGDKVRLIGLYEWLSATQSNLTIWVDGVKVGPITGTYDGSNGGFRQDGDRVLIGGRSAGVGLEYVANATIGDVAIFTGAVPNTDQITALTTQEVNKAMDGSYALKVFHALPPMESSLDDTVGPYTGTAVSVTPTRKIGLAVEIKDREPTFLLVGDPQNLNTARYATLGTFISDYATMLNVKAILFMGDWADSATAAQFLNARACVDLFRGKVIPYTLTVGNHDLTGDGELTRSTSTMDDSVHLPMTLIKFQPWFVSQYHASNDYEQYAHAIVVDLGYETDDLVIHLPFGPTIAMWEWAKTQAAAHAEKRVWLVIHAWQQLEAGDLWDDVTEWGPGDTSRYLLSEAETPLDPGGTVANSGADGSWELYAKHIPNLAGIFTGHATDSSNATMRVVRQASSGNRTLHLCVNNQERGSSSDGDGYLSILSIDANGRITAVAYEAVIDEFPTGDEEVFTDQVNPITIPAAPIRIGAGTSTSVPTSSVDGPQTVRSVGGQPPPVQRGM